ncbi:hypothetical protein Q9189_005507 [Teloschistes chrysophthalmus]
MSHIQTNIGKNFENGIHKLPFLFGLRSSKRFIGSACFVAAFTDGVLYSAVSDAKRHISLLAAIRFWITALCIAYGGSMLLGAPLARLITHNSTVRQVPLLVGLLSAAGGTLLFMFATRVWLLVVARCLQGISEGAIVTTVLALVVETVERNEVGSWVGFVLSGLNFGILVGPVLAGVIYEKAGYYAVFATCLGILLFDIFLTLALIDRRRARSWVGGGKIVKNDVGEQNRESDRSSGGEQESGISNGSNAKKQRLANGAKAKVHSNPHPNEVSPLLLDSTSQTEKSPKKWFAATRALLASPQILAALYGSFSDCVLTTSLDAVLPRFVQQTFHWTASEAGLIFLAVTLPSLVDPLFGTLCDRYGRRIVALGGFGLAAPSLALLGIVRNAGLSSKIGLVVFLFCLEWLILPWNPVGSGINAFLTSLVTDMSFAVEQLEQENPGLGGGNGVFTEAYALVDITFGLGLVIGPLISGLLYEKTNWGITVGVLAIFCVSGTLHSWLIVDSAT